MNSGANTLETQALPRCKSMFKHLHVSHDWYSNVTWIVSNNRSSNLKPEIHPIDALQVFRCCSPQPRLRQNRRLKTGETSDSMSAWITNSSTNLESVGKHKHTVHRWALALNSVPLIRPDSSWTDALVNETLRHPVAATYLEYYNLKIIYSKK